MFHSKASGALVVAVMATAFVVAGYSMYAQRASLLAPGDGEGLTTASADGVGDAAGPMDDAQGNTTEGNRTDAPEPGTSRISFREAPAVPRAHANDVLWGRADLSSGRR